MMFRNFHILQVGASTLAITMAFPALAQNGHDQPSTVVAAGGGSAPTAAASTETGLEEIVVTAQRKQENQQSVPISITTLTAAAAQRTGVTGTESLTIAVPSLQFSRQTGNGGAPYLRGVGTSQAAAGSSSPVAVYVDDVYVGAPTGSLLSFNNIAQIEVLKGPQGTLFGRNATGGVINIRTKRPSHDFALDATGGYGNYNTATGSLYATTGISDTLAVSVAAAATKQADGYGRDINTGEDVYKQSNYGVRAEALWTPSPNTNLLVIGDYARSHSDFGMNTTILPGAVGIGGTTYPGRYRTTHVPADSAINHQYGVSARLDHDFGPIRFASISAYRYSDLDPLQIDNDGSPKQFFRQTALTNTRAFSQELQFLSPKDSKLQWIAGAFYYNEKAQYDPLTSRGLAIPGGGSVNRSSQLLNSYAGFGEVNYEVLPNTRITAGLRYTTDMFKTDTVRTSLDGSVILPPGAFEQKSNFSKLTYRAVIDHHFTRDVMVYGSYSRGFKSGGYNISAPVIVIGGVSQPSPVVAPEVLDAFEIGFKSELLDHKVRLNASIFDYDYKNLQVVIVVPGASYALNAAKARIKGADIDFSVAPTGRLTFTAAASFLDAKYTSFHNAPISVPNPAVCAPLIQMTGPATGGNLTCSGDATGNRTSRAPKFTTSISGTYRLPTDAGDFALTTSFYHNSGYFWEPDNRLRQPNYNLVNTTLSWLAKNGKYEASVWAKNLTNTYYYLMNPPRRSRILARRKCQELMGSL